MSDGFEVPDRSKIPYSLAGRLAHYSKLKPRIQVAVQEPSILTLLMPDQVSVSNSSTGPDDTSRVGAKLYRIAAGDEQTPNVQVERKYGVGQEHCYCPGCMRKFGEQRGGWVPARTFIFTDKDFPDMKVELSYRELHYLREGRLEYNYQENGQLKFRNLFDEYYNAKAIGL